METKLNLNSLIKAIEQFKQGLSQAQLHPHDELMRDGVIQRFEYTMDLAWKMMQRYLKMIQIEESVIRSKNDIFRESACVGLIDNPEAWIGYYSARNETSHDHDHEKANALYIQAAAFLPDVQIFFENFKKMIQENYVVL